MQYPALPYISMQIYIFKNSILSSCSIFSAHLHFFFHSLVHSANAYQQQNQARQKLGCKSSTWFSHVGNNHSCFLPVCTWIGMRIQSRGAGLELRVLIRQASVWKQLLQHLPRTWKKGLWDGLVNHQATLLPHMPCQVLHGKQCTLVRLEINKSSILSLSRESSSVNPRIHLEQF